LYRKLGACHRVKFFQLPCNAGTYVAKTFGLKYAKGEFITCHDSDDWSHPMRIQLQTQPLIKDANLVATISDWVRLNEDGVPYARGVLPIMRLNPASPLFRKSTVLKKMGAWDLVRTGADSEFIHRLKLIYGGDRIERIRQPLTFGAHRPGSLMTALDSGYSENNKDNKRLDYWESWRYWHINCIQLGNIPSLDIEAGKTRPFNAPDSLQIDANVIKLCLEA
jgi:glycosyltransferase involved in cell wall biosynthesis